MEVQGSTFFMLSRWSHEFCDLQGINGKSELKLTALPLSEFRNAPAPLQQSRVTSLPGGETETKEVRFMDGWMVYHQEPTDVSEPTQKLTRVEANAPRKLYATRLDRPSLTISAKMPHEIDRLQPLAGGMLAVGQASPKNLALSWLSPATDFSAGATLTLRGRIESEGRSHAFSATTLPDRQSLFGLPTIKADDGEIRSVARTATSNLSFMTMTTQGVISQVGDIAMARAKPRSNYKCEVSCIDWYGNSRAIFTGGRIFALLGTEIVEGALANNEIGVIKRLDMTSPVENNSN
jgi:hypothetical protein